MNLAQRVSGDVESGQTHAARHGQRGPRYLLPSPSPAPYTVNPSPYSAPYTLHPTPYTLHPKLYTLHPTLPYALHARCSSWATRAPPCMWSICVGGCELCNFLHAHTRARTHTHAHIHTHRLTHQCTATMRRSGTKF